MTYLVSPSLMAPLGHSGAQAPHMMHSSLILKDTLSRSFRLEQLEFLDLLRQGYCNPRRGEYQGVIRSGWL